MEKYQKLFTQQEHRQNMGIPCTLRIRYSKIIATDATPDA
jgi:hypothetical protein